MLAYLDHHATTPCATAVVEAMEPWWRERFANPASRLHRPGLEAAAAVERARGQVGQALGMGEEAVVFTSGATEANNLALRGVVEAAREDGQRRCGLVTLATEHRAVLDPLAALARQGAPLTVLPVGSDGLVDLDRLAEALTPDTLLLSVMAANNEIGVVQPLEAIADLCRRQGVLLHCDAAQAVGHIPLSMAELGVDLLTLSAHKFYGPKGVGALLLRPGLRVAPQQLGGGQERGLRAGTLPVPLIIGLATALDLALADREERARRLGGLRDQLWGRLQELGGVERNGSAHHGLPHNLNVTLTGVEGNRLHQLLRRRLAVSSGSACAAGSPSHVLAALGRDRREAAATIRFGLGRDTGPEEVDAAVAAVAEALSTLRRPA
ncbi:MAG: cysteine desulfurase family protein [Cyanobacteriota bacterium]|nr:cysteine desulfurase family protein [Cyanobacteriota bacterium]